MAPISLESLADSPPSYASPKLDLHEIHDTLVCVAHMAGDMMRSADPSVDSSDTKKNSSDRVTATNLNLMGNLISRESSVACSTRDSLFRPASSHSPGCGKTVEDDGFPARQKQKILKESRVTIYTVCNRYPAGTRTHCTDAPGPHSLPYTDWPAQPVRTVTGNSSLPRASPTTRTTRTQPAVSRFGRCMHVWAFIGHKARARHAPMALFNR